EPIQRNDRSHPRDIRRYVVGGGRAVPQTPDHRAVVAGDRADGALDDLRLRAAASVDEGRGAEAPDASRMVGRHFCELWRLRRRDHSLLPEFPIPQSDGRDPAPKTAAIDWDRAGRGDPQRTIVEGFLVVGPRGYLWRLPRVVSEPQAERSDVEFGHAGRGF